MTSSDLVALVARLWADHHYQLSRQGEEDADDRAALSKDAAAAIEQLQAEVAAVAHAGKTWKTAHDLAAEERDSLRAELAAVKRKIDELFPVIAHGDDKHRAWLKDAIEKHFDAARAQAGGE